MDDALRIMWMVSRGMTMENAVAVLAMAESLLNIERVRSGVGIYVPRDGRKPYASHRREYDFDNCACVFEVVVYDNPFNYEKYVEARWNEAFDLTLPTPVTGDPWP